MNRFKNNLTQQISEGELVKGLAPGLIRKAKIKIFMVLSARKLETLLIPPSNRLEKLAGNRKGQYSIRVNDKYRICFNWLEDLAFNIEFVDYH